MSKDFDRNSFLASSNGAFIEELYARYLDDAAAVDPSWRDFFTDLRDEAPAVWKSLNGASWSPRRGRVIGGGAEGHLGAGSAKGNGATPDNIAPTAHGGGNGGGNGGVPPGQAASDQSPTSDQSDELRAATRDSLQAVVMIRAYRLRGHLIANLDPLGLKLPEFHAELDPRTYGFTDADMGRRIFLDNVLGLEYPTLGEILDTVRETYCGTIGVEFMHIQEPDQRQWIRERIEAVHNRTEFTGRGKRAILERLIEAESFEKFLNTKYVGAKRFGLDGGESLIPALEQILKRGSQLGIEEVVFGMPHRGRLSVLAHVMNKPFAAILCEFEGLSINPEGMQGSGDVKYHLGTSADREFDGRKVHLSLNSNPSHLEAVDPVVVGRVRAKQRQLGDKERRRVLAVLMHGDAAFAGQGLVAETFGLSDVRGYRTGGTIHVVVNNQIGFTTNPQQARSSPYPTEIAKTVQAPIFHVNGDDVEAVVHVARIATEFRQEFRKDVVIDMWCYRRFGHNEGDEPAFTQPLMYKAIAEHPTTSTIYMRKMIDEGSVVGTEIAKIAGDCKARLECEFEATDSYKPDKADWFGGAWSHLDVAPTHEERRGKTDVSPDILRRIGAAMTAIPDDFNLHPRLERVFAGRRAMIETGKDVDWSTAEALAFGTLLTEGYLVRLSGQDVQRGTFSQRHAVLVDQETESRYTPLEHVGEGQARFAVHNSPLAEGSVLGYEYGISLTEPDALVMWEAQFGDFANGAQVITDQFISSAESKWLRLSGIVLLLPHGHEGQGPEHSSARPERFLQLCGDDNIQVVNCTTPANYFHVLRRQIHREFRKPLVIMTPKSLLRHKACVSGLHEMGPGTYFDRVIGERDRIADDTDIRRVVLCSGKVYYDLHAERGKRGITDIALLRLEQLYPFPFYSLTKELKRYPAAEIIWCQEEPANMGAWTFLDRRIERVLADAGSRTPRPVLVGRPESASPAAGLARRHGEEQAALVDEALSLA